MVSATLTCREMTGASEMDCPYSGIVARHVRSKVMKIKKSGSQDYERSYSFGKRASKGGLATLQGDAFCVHQVVVSSILEAKSKTKQKRTF